jgi:hypothetical protein
MSSENAQSVAEAPLDRPVDPSTITADDFLIEIFAGIPGRVVLCRQGRGNGGFYQLPWRPGLCATLPPACWYFCISTSVAPIKPNGTITRQFVDLRRTACIVLDDVGTRIPREVVTLPPSWVLKSSVKLWDHAAGKEAPGGAPTENFQIGYILDGGVDPSSAARLLDAIERNVDIDEAVLTAVTQPYRVPGALNLKHDPPFAARLVLWEPSTRYLPSEIARHYAVTPPPKPAEPRPITRRFDNDDDQVWRALQRGRYLLSDQPRHGWYAVKCPWQDQHHDHSMDGKAGSGVAYKPRQGDRGAVFKCFHSSCASRSWSDLFRLLVRRPRG